MGRIYTATFDGIAMAAAQDILALVAPSDLMIRLWEFHLFQITDIQDAGELIETIRVRSGQTTVGSGGAAVTPVPHLLGDVASTATVRRNDTTQAVSGTIVEHYHWGWNIRVPFEKIWTPETTPWIIPSRRMTFELPEAPGSSITGGAVLVFEEVG